MAITDYEIIKQIGAGGMGAIYLARDPRLDRLVAIKKLRIQTNIEEDVRKEVLQRFYREARTIANISHPNIVTIYELGEDKETKECFMVMEYLDGKTVETMLESNISLSINDALKIGVQVSEALAFIHSKGVIHRDIKPSNLILCKNEMIKIIDFGLVRTNDSLDLTKAGSLLGSVLYMSPEQIMNPKEIDHRVDIYALGVTLYQALSGNFPFEGDDVWEVITKITRDEPIALSKKNPYIPKELEQIIMKSIAKREKRYTNAEDFQKDLFHFNMSNSQTAVSPLGYERMMKNYLSPEIVQTPPVSQHGTGPLNPLILSSELITTDPNNFNHLTNSLEFVTDNNEKPDLKEHNITIISHDGYSPLTKKSNFVSKAEATIISSDGLLKIDDNLKEKIEDDIKILDEISLEKTFLEFEEENDNGLEKTLIRENELDIIEKTENELISDKLNLYLQNLKIEIKSSENIIKNLKTILEKNNEEIDTLQFEINDLKSTLSRFEKQQRNSILNNIYQDDIKQIEDKISTKKMQKNFRDSEVEQAQEKLEAYKKIYQYQSLMKKLLTFFDEELDEKNSKTFLKHVTSVFQITENEVEKIRELIENRMNKLIEIDSIYEKLDVLNKELENLNLNTSQLETITSIIRFIPKENSVEARLLKDLKSSNMLEFDFEKYEVFFASPTIILDNRNVLKAKKMDIVLIKLDCFGCSIEDKISINTSIYESNSRIIRKDLLEGDLELYKKIMPYFDTIKSLAFNNTISCFENLDSLFENICEPSHSFKFTPETRQIILAKVSRIKKNIFELKKDLEFEEEIEKNFYLKNLSKIAQTLNRFPFILRDFERVIRNKKEERKKFVQSIFTTISKLEANELKKDFDSFYSKIDSLQSSEIPISLISVLKFYLNLKTRKPTEISKNDILLDLNKERDKLSTPEIDWVCKILDLRYTREKGFILSLSSKVMKKDI